MEGYGGHGHPMEPNANAEGSKRGSSCSILDRVGISNGKIPAFNPSNYRMSSTPSYGGVGHSGIKGTSNSGSQQPRLFLYPTSSAPHAASTTVVPHVIPNNYQFPAFPAPSTAIPRHSPPRPPADAAQWSNGLSSTPVSHYISASSISQICGQESSIPEYIHTRHASNGLSNTGGLVLDQEDAKYGSLWNGIMTEPGAWNPDFLGTSLWEYYPTDSVPHDVFDPALTCSNSFDFIKEDSSFNNLGISNSSYSTPSTHHTYVYPRHRSCQTELGSLQTSPETMVLANNDPLSRTDRGLQYLSDDRPGNADIEHSLLHSEGHANNADGGNDIADGQNLDTGDRPLTDAHSEPISLEEANKRAFKAYKEELRVSDPLSDSARKLYTSWYKADKAETKELLHKLLAVADGQEEPLTMFTTLEEARETLTRDKATSINIDNDPTFPRTKAQKQVYVAQLVKAMKSSEYAQDNDKELARWKTNHVRKVKLIELRCWETLEDAMEVHTLGKLNCFDAVVVRDKTKYDSFEDRMIDILRTLRLRKSLCKGLLDPPRRLKLVHDPLVQDEQMESNKKTNGGKSEDIKEGKEAKKAKKSKEVSKPVTPRHGSTDAVAPSVSTLDNFQNTDSYAPDIDASVFHPQLCSTSYPSQPQSHHRDCVFPHTPENGKNGHEYSPAENFDSRRSAGLHRPNPQSQPNMHQRRSLRSRRSSAPLSTILDADSPPAPMNISQSRTQSKTRPKRKKCTTSEPPQPTETKLRIAEKHTPEWPQQPQTKSAGRPRKRLREPNDGITATKRPRI
ncbi:hypothetical protein BJX63DRAFT_361801 [Aspergillus granulosus]|uniref:Uncharacterized protein n=1 Tax=Aspergillus granulosus TaxID=176169 RepID=A0ABR4HWN4_9EURO